MRDNEADELENVELCTHESVECRCQCHMGTSGQTILHDKPCCRPCYRCGFRRAEGGKDWRMDFVFPR